MANLEPKVIFDYFSEICKVPRPSKKEARMTEWLLQTGKELGLATKRDAAGNVLIAKPATPGKENVTPIIFQAHMDMVCEKNNDTVFDFEKDAIQTYVEDGWMHAKGTTLGADDGIGIAIALAVLANKEIEHGPIECLFTVDEETGLTGAAELQPGFMNGKMLLNLDDEDWGEFCIGCAGGIDTVAKYDCEFEKQIPANSVAYKVMVGSLKGGHSGDDIEKNRGNAVKLLNRILWNAYQEYDARIADIQAGNLRNAIAREGWAIITLPKENAGDFEKYVAKMDAAFKNELHTSDAGVFAKCEKAKMPAKVIDEMLQIDVLNALYACPHGILAMSQDIPGFVETSTNLASVKLIDNQIVVTTSQRSSVESRKQDAADQVACAFYSTAADEVEHSDGYPGWEPNAKSEVLKLMVQAFHNLHPNEEPTVRAIHAGLECGLISEKYPELDMVAFGPTLRGVHSPDEKLEIESVKKVWDLIVEFIRILK